MSNIQQSGRRLGSAVADELQFLEIVDWDDFLHPDTTRKCKPPYRWVKLNTENLDTMGDLSLREYGAYCRLIMLAASTNNRTRFNPGWIKRRTGITQVLIENLSKRNLVRIVSESELAEKAEQNQSDSSGNASGHDGKPPQKSGQEGRGKGSDLNNTGGDESARPPLAGSSIDSPPLPNPNLSMNGRKRDPRSFDDLKPLVLTAATKLGTRDPDQIHKLAGPSLRMSPKQITTAVNQLIEDGKL